MFEVLLLVFGMVAGAILAFVLSVPRHLPGTCEDCGIPLGAGDTLCESCDDARQW